MSFSFKRYLPLAAASLLLAVGIAANAVAAGIRPDELPEIDFADVPTTDNAYTELQTAQTKLNSANEQINQLNAQITEKQKSIGDLESRANGLQTEIDKFAEGQEDIEALEDRYTKCVEEARRLANEWNGFLKIEKMHLEPNYDVNNLKNAQNKMNIYNVFGDVTGFWGNLLADSLTTSNYRGYDAIMAAVDSMTATANEHLYNADMLISKIRTKIKSVDTLLTEELSSEDLLFEVELFESSYFGNDDLFEKDRIELLREMETAHAIVSAIYPVYKMMLSDSYDNTNFLEEMRIRNYNMGVYINDYVKKPGDTGLTEEEIGNITYSIYSKLFPMICKVITDTTYGYVNVNVRNDRIPGSEPYRVIIGEKGKDIFAIYMYEALKNMALTREFYYLPDGTPLYIVDHKDIVCLSVDGNIVYTNTDMAKAERMVKTVKARFTEFHR